jgi:hypothetical protein
VPGDPGSLSAAGGAARRAARELAGASARGTTAYLSLKDGWGTSTSVRTRKEGQRSMAALERGGEQADVVGAALQTYAGELSELQARARRLVEAVAAAGLALVDGQVRPAWGVTGEADPRVAHESQELRRTLQAELDGIGSQHRRRRERLLAQLTESTHTLDAIANDLRLR